MNIYVYRYADKAPQGTLWVEVAQGLSVHPADLETRLRALLAVGKTHHIATQSDVVLSIIGWLVRTKQVALPFSLVYVDGSGKEYHNHYCSDGTLLHPWPEGDSIIDAGFHYRNVE